MTTAKAVFHLAHNNPIMNNTTTIRVPNDSNNNPSRLSLNKKWPPPAQVMIRCSSSSAAAVLLPCDFPSFTSPPSRGVSVLGERNNRIAMTRLRSSGAGAAVTLKRSKKFEMAPQQITEKDSFSPQLSTGGDGGDNGNTKFLGGSGSGSGSGGGGGNYGGDDDNYFDDFDEEDDGDDQGGLFRKRLFLQELFDREFVDAIMSEWMKTMMDLPAGFRQAYEMGLVSSAQMVKLLSIIARPTISRAISRALSQGLSRAFIGRLIADPAFLYRLLLEQAATIGVSVWLEVTTRRERIKQEWDLALINVLTMSACNAAVVWSLAPCHSYGDTFRYDWQKALQKLPNNIFESSYRLREFDSLKRIHSFLYKAAELFLVGMASGAAQGAVSNLCASKKKQSVSVAIPSVSRNALGYGAFLGIHANLRYQLLCGIDRALTNHFDVIGVALFFSTALRILNVQLGEASRLAWLGIETDSLASGDVLKTFERPSVAKSKQPWDWSILKDGLGLFGLEQGPHAEPDAPKPRRKKIVHRKVTPQLNTVKSAPGVNFESYLIRMREFLGASQRVFAVRNRS